MPTRSKRAGARRALALALLLVPALCRCGAAQTPVVRVAGRIHMQATDVSGGRSPEFNPDSVTATSIEERRLRIWVEARIGERITMVLQPAFEMGTLRMTDAWVRLALSRHVGVTLGQEKKPFNRYELTTSNTLPSIERGLRVRGFRGDIAAQNNLLEANGYIMRDLGASLDASAAGGRVALKAGVYNGAGESSNDVDNAKTFAGRVTATALTDGLGRPLLRLGFAVISRDRAVTTTATSAAFVPDSARRTTAFGLDAEWGDFRPGLHLIADFATGKNLASGAYRFDVGRNLGNVRPGAPDSAFTTFATIQAVVAWRFQADSAGGPRLVKIVEPALRLDYTDPNTARGGAAGFLVTPAVSLYFSESTALRVGVDLFRYHDPLGAAHTLRAWRLTWQSGF